MFYAVTNHLFPKPEYFDAFVDRFAGSDGAPVTESGNAVRFEMRRPAEGNEWLSTSISPNAEVFQAWRDGPEFKRNHERARQTMDQYSQRPTVRIHEVVVNAGPGRKPLVGQPIAYPRLGRVGHIAIRRFLPATGHEVDVVDDFSALTPPDGGGFAWWVLWRAVKDADWWSISFFEEGAAAETVRSAGFSGLTEPGNAAWYQGSAAETSYRLELERVPGMDEAARHEVVEAGA